MTTHRDAFLQDILENPEDDAPRLIFADWLDEFGDDADRARAELIRLQCRLAQEGSSPELWARARQLRGAYIGRWLGPLTGLGFSLDFRRGMVRAGISAAKFLSPHVQRIALEWFPRAGVHELHLRGDYPDPHAVTASPVLASVHTLHWSGCRLRDEAVRRLVDSPHLGALKFLRFKHALLSDAGVGRLAASPHLRQLRGLALIDRDRWARFASREEPSQSLRAWERWAEGRARITPAAVRLLLADEQFPHLRDLALVGTAWDLGEWGTFFAVPGLARLRALDLTGNGMTDEAAGLLAFCPHLADLTRLNLSGNRFTAAGVRAILDSPHLPGLQSFTPGGTLSPELQHRLRERFPGRRP